MYLFTYNLLLRFLPAGLVRPAAYCVSVFLVLALCLLVRFIVRFLLVRISSRLVGRTKSVWDDIFFKNHLFHRAANLAFPITAALFLKAIPGGYALLSRVVGVSFVLFFGLVLESAIRSFGEIYNLYEISKVRPIRGFLQVVQVTAFVVGVIICIAILIGESPLVLLGGIGAMTAVTSFIFKDAILGFVAGIQLTTNDMIRIGDWVEVPQCSANGDVIDLSMTTVKVQNFDKTITSIPAYTLVSQAFINWRGMEQTGGRRIKRAIYIDVARVRICDEAMLQKLQSLSLLREYLSQKTAEINAYNQAHSSDLSQPANGRRLTNIGTFRAYALAYLRSHPGIHQGLSIMVRQLEPQDKGIPLELYAFTNTVNWPDYEGIQADIFDHLFAVIGEFDLAVYQQPSGNDIRRGLNS